MFWVRWPSALHHCAVINIDIVQLLKISHSLPFHIVSNLTLSFLCQYAGSISALPFACSYHVIVGTSIDRSRSCLNHFSLCCSCACLGLSIGTCFCQHIFPFLPCSSSGIFVGAAVVCLFFVSFFGSLILPPKEVRASHYQFSCLPIHRSLEQCLDLFRNNRRQQSGWDRFAELCGGGFSFFLIQFSEQL